MIPNQISDGTINFRVLLYSGKNATGEKKIALKWARYKPGGQHREVKLLSEEGEKETDVWRRG